MDSLVSPAASSPSRRETGNRRSRIQGLPVHTLDQGNSFELQNGTSHGHHLAFEPVRQRRELGRPTPDFPPGRKRAASSGSRIACAMSLERITAADSRELDLPRFFLRAVPLAARAADPLLKDAKSILEVARNVRSSRPGRPDLRGDERPALGPRPAGGAVVHRHPLSRRAAMGGGFGR